MISVRSFSGLVKGHGNTSYLEEKSTQDAIGVCLINYDISSYLLINVASLDLYIGVHRNQRFHLVVVVNIITRGY